jgi:hypothetical protein
MKGVPRNRALALTTHRRASSKFLRLQLATPLLSSSTTGLANSQRTPPRTLLLPPPSFANPSPGGINAPTLSSLLSAPPGRQKAPSHYTCRSRDRRRDPVAPCHRDSPTSIRSETHRSTSELPPGNVYSKTMPWRGNSAKRRHRPIRETRSGVSPGVARVRWRLYWRWLQHGNNAQAPSSSAMTKVWCGFHRQPLLTSGD